MKQDQQSPNQLSLVRLLLGFLDRNLARFSPLVQNAIGLIIVLLLVYVILNSFVTRTFIRGQLWVTQGSPDKKARAVGYVLSHWDEESTTNNKGIWTLPIYGAIPRNITIHVQGPDQVAALGSFSFIGPWPIWSQIFPPEFTHVIGGNGVVSVSNDGAGTVLRWIRGRSYAYAQPLPPCTDLPANPDIKPPTLVSPTNNATIPQPYEKPWEFIWDYPFDTHDIMEYRLCIKGELAVKSLIDTLTTELRYEQPPTCGGFIVERNRYNWIWKVRARNRRGEWSPWSEHKFHVKLHDWKRFCEKCPTTLSCRR